LLGTWAEGTKIPSIRDMAVATEVNPNTVLRSYSYLQEKDIIQNQRGVGYFVAERGLERTKQLLTATFVKTELPRVFKTMDLLQFKFDDLKPYYAEFKKAQKN
jgi:GntR family transcriptional regulator